MVPATRAARTSSPVVFLSVLALLAFGHTPAEAQTAREDLWMTNGTVNAAVVHGNLLYIGGDFTYVGPLTARGVPIDVATGQVQSPLPIVGGELGGNVRAVASDGAGGWYVGGEFGQVGGVARGSLAHILADGTV